MKKHIKFVLLLMAINLSTISIAGAQEASKSECSQKIQELGNILLSINSKIVAMPPLVTIYTSASNVWDKARVARDAGNYQECVRLNNIGISSASPYAR
jgi:hypothetical protein